MRRRVSKFLMPLAILLVMGSGFFLLSLRNHNPNSSIGQEYSGSPIPSPTLQPIQGKNVPLEIARSLAKFEIRTPSYLSADAKLVSVRLTTFGGKDLVTLIYSSDQLEDKLYVDQVVGSGGMVIIETPDSNDPTTAIQKIVSEMGGSVKAITVNGYLGMGTGERVVDKRPILCQIHWWANGVHYNIIADLSLEELIKVAESM